MLYTPACTNPNKNSGSGYSPLEAIATPFPTRTIDCVWDHSFSSKAGELCGSDIPQSLKVNCMNIARDLYTDLLIGLQIFLIQAF